MNTKITNFIKYGTMDLPQQVDSEFMEKKFENSINSSSYKNGELKINKESKETLGFSYKVTDPLFGLNGTIHCQEPRKGLEFTDTKSIMEINGVYSTKPEEVLDLASDVALKAGIEKIVLWDNRQISNISDTPIKFSKDYTAHKEWLKYIRKD